MMEIVVCFVPMEQLLAHQFKKIKFEMNQIVVKDKFSSRETIEIDINSKFYNSFSK